ncbi:hypothetical protein PUN28_011981 [Cardiocondyla obscurior]|uniref:Uncharacterized protein n=1 Tax=Cardiocondyla obscurior TaxID=286306 RepID=A0AAW2FB62_9HYME
MTKVGDLVGTDHLRTYLRNNDSSLLMSRYLLGWRRAIINSSVLIVLFRRLAPTQLSQSGIITCQFPRNTSGRIRKTNDFREPVARGCMLLACS